MKKNVLIIGDDFCLERGGIENTSYLLAEHLNKYFNIITLSPCEGHTLYGVNSIVSKSKANSILFVIDSYRIIKKLIKDNKVDYVISMHHKHGVVLSLLKKKYNIPFGVLTYGDEIIKWRRGSMKTTIAWAIYLPIMKIVLNSANQIFCCSHYTKTLAQKVTSNKNIIVINPPIGLLPEKDFLKVQSKSYMLSIGRLVERKGFHNVIKALPQVLEKYPDLKYYVAGDGYYLNELKRLVSELKITNSVIFKGKVSEEEKKELLSNCGVFLMPSFAIPNLTVEGFGLSLLEANVYGKFVISSRSGGITDAVVDNVTGFLVKENDVDSLSDAILRFYDKDFTYDVSKCVDWAKDKHISKVAERYYNSIIPLIK